MSSIVKNLSRVIGRIALIAISGALFVAGVLGTIFFSVRSPEVEVPKIVGVDRFTAEETLRQANLEIRERQSRYDPEVKPGTVLDQNPRAGDIVKQGQTIAIVTSRNQAREGEEAIFQALAEMKRQEAEAAANSNEADAPTNTSTNANRSESIIAKTINANANRRAANRNTNKALNANNANNLNSNNTNVVNAATNTDGANNANRNSVNTTPVNRPAPNTNATNANNRNAAARNSNANARPNTNTRSNTNAVNRNREN